MKKTHKLKPKFKIEPLSDRVLVKPLSEEEKKSPSGIIMPETISKDKPEQGTVVAVGPGKYDENGKKVPMNVEVGDTVIFSKYGYDDIKIDDIEYFILKDEQILAKVTK